MTWLKLKGYLYGLLAFLAAIAGAVLYGVAKGRASQRGKTEAAQSEAATAQATTKQMESRHETDVQVSNLPEAPAQHVDDADPATAAGKLRDSGFVRD